MNAFLEAKAMSAMGLNSRTTSALPPFNGLGSVTTTSVIISAKEAEGFTFCKYKNLQELLKETQVPSKQLVTYVWIRIYSTCKCLLGDCSVGTSRCSAVGLQLQAISMCFTEASGSSSSAKRSADQRTCKLVNKTKCKLAII